MKSPSIALLAAFVTGASSFGVNPGSATSRSRTNTALHLLPTQGNQLAAASNAALAKEPREEGSDAADATPTNAAREFVARLFSLPSKLQKSSSASSITELASMAALFDGPYRGGRDDVVLYPITGFRWVKVSDGDFKVLPTTANAACSVPNLPSRQEEEVVGWYSPACKLGSLYSLDDTEYCSESTLQ